ncbi:MAG: DUF3343 domain-containing protein [Marinilabiliales bacterium]|nr:DUF3343 domain-containing protein [Marinilabiliales bacterium]
MTLENRDIFLFQNIRQVILAERWSTEQRLDVRVKPVPRPYSSECGMCLSIGSQEGDRLEAFTRSRGMEIRRIAGGDVPFVSR